MNKTYHIVWFDDKFSESEAIILAYDDNNISFTGFENAEEGVYFLKSQYKEVDAVVIDGNFYSNKGDDNIDTAGKALNMVLESLVELKQQKEIPYFILSGMMNFRMRESGIFSIKNLPKIYDKNIRSEVEELCQEIRKQVDATPTRQIINKYMQVFEICNENCLGAKHKENLLSIINSIEENKAPDYNLIRKVLESLFVRLAQIQVLPSGFTDEKGWISGASTFLSARHSQYEFKEPNFIHPLISETLYRILRITQDGSHNEGTLTLKVDGFTRQQNTGYLYKSTVYAFLEIMSYFSHLILTNLDVDINKKRWHKKDIVYLPEDHQNWIEGYVAEINYAGWGTFVSADSKIVVNIHPLTIAKHRLKKDDLVKIILKEDRKDHIKTIEKR